MLYFWKVQERKQNAGFVDVVWSLGTALCAIGLATISHGLVERRLIVEAMACIWGARLGALFVSRLRREGEDGRYQGFREKYGDQIQTFMFKFFQLQALWALLFALPMVAAAQSTAAIGPLDYAGIAIFVIAIGGEYMADSQLAKFKHDPANRSGVCQSGLWKYSRHPNYFFEWVHWFSYLALAWYGPWRYVALAGVVIMFWFLTKVTGIPYAEAQSLKSRGEKYAEYQRTTSPFIPMPPRRAS